MKTKYIYVLLGLLLLVGVGGVFILLPKNNQSDSNVPNLEAAPDSIEPAEDAEPVVTDLPVSTYTMAEIQAHADETSCWTTVNGNVYDITSAIPTHKGGKENIMKVCGNDGTEAFTQKHGGEEKPESWLETLKIGVLADMAS